MSRAREGVALSPRDRETAGDLLQQWRESEEVAPGTGDPSLGRALEAMTLGRALAPDELGALRRFDEARRRERAEAAEAPPGPGAPEGAAPPGALARPRGGAWRLLRDCWFVPVAGATVVVLGAAWILAARALRGRWR